MRTNQQCQPCISSVTRLFVICFTYLIKEIFLVCLRVIFNSLWVHVKYLILVFFRLMSGCVDFILFCAHVNSTVDLPLIKLVMYKSSFVQILISTKRSLRETAAAVSRLPPSPASCTDPVCSLIGSTTAYRCLRSRWRCSRSVSTSCQSWI